MDIDQELSATLNACDKNQLEKYLNDRDSIDVLIASLEQFQLANSKKEALQETNKKLAEENLSKKPVIDELRTKLTEAITELESAKDEYFKLLTRNNEISDNQNMSLEAIYTVLQTSATKSEEETDKLAEDFFLDDTKKYTDEELNQFQRLFLENRTNAHLKKIKADKLKELLGNI